jgi:hypothetical protein
MVSSVIFAGRVSCANTIEPAEAVKPGIGNALKIRKIPDAHQTWWLKKVTLVFKEFACWNPQSSQW